LPLISLTSNELIAAERHPGAFEFVTDVSSAIPFTDLGHFYSFREMKYDWRVKVSENAY
jgi:hypothetical protein